MRIQCLLLLFEAAALASARALPQRAPGDAASPIIDLGYAQYQGYYNSSFDLNIYRGIRFAAPPKRWQRPEAPVSSREKVLEAVNDPPRCPQALPGPTPAVVDFEGSLRGNEDCLFLNIFSPKNATKLPVVVWIHGGGYGAGSAPSFDYSYIGQTVNNGIVSVAIQYRLGAFGFASSAEIAKHGIVNAGVHDMIFALEWVQKYISLFGGDPDQVTISGESAGGGSVMLLTMANGGTHGTKLFRRAIASSPYFPTQPDHDGGLPTDYYNQLARRAGCTPPPADTTIFQCLQAVDSLVLQNASAYTSYAAKNGQWAFIPVTDSLIPTLPTSLPPKLNGEAILVGTNANEGTYFVPRNITSREAFLSFVTLNYPTLSSEGLRTLLSLYTPAAETISSTPYPLFDTDGINPPFATSVSGYALGWQQAANNLYAETTFVCPAYWLADAYGTKAWRYQVSTPNAFHGVDIAMLTTDPGKDVLKRGFQEIWGRFIVGGDPTLLEATTAKLGDDIGAAAKWRAWGDGATLLSLNATAGRAHWKIADGITWEGGRGVRCDFWKEVGSVFAEV
ncbi:hypothetical protein OQA88_1267 [Cercophora sp. LCS_1]